MPPKIKLVTLQRVCPGYRKALFSELSNNVDLDFTLIVGEDLPNSKVKNAQDLSKIQYIQLPTKFIRLYKRLLAWHCGLIQALKEIHPEVILCEGESNFLSYVQAIIYKYKYDKKVKLIHWCFISLPGGNDNPSFIRSLIKRIMRGFFDAFLVYSSYSKEQLLKLGIAAHKVTVATNVCDTDKFLLLEKTTKATKSEAQKLLRINNKFTVLYSGTLDANKRPDMMLELAKLLPPHNFNFVLVGGGKQLGTLQQEVKSHQLTNVTLTGKVQDNLGLYYRAADVLIIPSRGGIVISEAMTFGLPVILHQADGTEYDLVKSDITGIRLDQGNTRDFAKAILKLQQNPEVCKRMGDAAHKLIKTQFTTNNMVLQIIKAVKSVKVGFK